MRPVGQQLEAGVDASSLKRREAWTKAGILLALVVAGMAVFPRLQGFDFQVQVGDIWREDAVVAPRQFSIFKSDLELAEEFEAIRYRIPPIFERREEALVRSLANVDTLESTLRGVFQVYFDWQNARMRGQGAAAQNDSLRYLARRSVSGLSFTSRQWSYLMDSYAAASPGIESSNRVTENGRTLESLLLQYTRATIRRLYVDEVLNIPKDSIRTDELVVRQGVTQRTAVKDEVLGIDELVATARDNFRRRFPARTDTIDIGIELFQRAFVAPLEYQRDESEERWAAQQARISLTRDLVQEGERIVDTGEIVTEEVLARLNSLSRSMADQRGQIDRWKLLLGELVLVLVAYLMFFLFLYLLRHHIFDNNKHVALISVLFGLTLAGFYVVLRIQSLPELVVPVTIASILLTVIYDSRVGVFGTLSLAFLGGVYFGFDFKFMSMTLFAAVVAVFSVRDIKHRAQFMVTAALVFVAYLTLLLAFSLLEILPWGERFINDLIQVSINSVLVLFTFPLLWVFERVFRVTTDVSLLELSDTNQPLLRELSLRAPGTFNHSLQVANLSEAACDAIGANALLARVGALYHDIGKMTKPEYFVENQQPGVNPHDRLKPSMSALILVNHVKDGVELGKQRGLPQVVIDFIAMHHGTHRIEYFYQRALAENGSGPAPLESNYRYPGPRPRTKETGVLMLADAVEAASKSMEKPTPKRLENLIDAIIKSRLEDGQLDHCPLTFAELTKIKTTFLGVLSGMYHFRVKYPDQDQAEEGIQAEADTRIISIEESESDGAPEGSASDPEAAPTKPAPTN
ncbi:MAG: HDIG domain-containing metalloprotein [Bacteroidota bacterium]